MWGNKSAPNDYEIVSSNQQQRLFYQTQRNNSISHVEGAGSSLTSNKPIDLTKPRKYCPKCSILLGSNDDATNHSCISQDKLHSCPVCGKKFELRFYLNNHIRRHYHRQFVCPICSASFDRKFRLKQHLATFSVDKPFDNSPSGIEFTHQDEVLKHQQMHSAVGKAKFNKHCGKNIGHRYGLQCPAKTLFNTDEHSLPSSASERRLCIGNEGFSQEPEESSYYDHSLQLPDVVQVALPAFPIKLETVSQILECGGSLAGIDQDQYYR